MTHDHPPQDHKAKCEAALEQLFDFLDGELDDSLEAELKVHVERCKPCFDRADFERRFLEVIATARAEERCPKALKDRVIATLRAQGLQA